MGNVCVTLVRQTETQLLARGEEVLPLARAAQARLDTQFTAALEAHHRIESQSRRLTQGKALPHGNIVNAYAPTIAPMCTGKRHGPAQFGRTPGMIAEPAAGFILGLHLPVGNPNDASYVEPLVDHVEQAIARISTSPRPVIHARAGDLALNEAALREAWHQRGMLTVGIPKTVEPLTPSPTPEEGLRVLDEAGLHRTRDPIPGAPRLRLWVQPTSRGTHHGQSAGPWSRAPHLHRPPRRDDTDGHGGHGT
jgi:hypothetical protein